MRLIVAVVGKPRNAGLAAAIEEYETRAARYWPLDVHEVREERASGLSPSVVRKREGERLRDRAGDGSDEGAANQKRHVEHRAAVLVEGHREQVEPAER